MLGTVISHYRLLAPLGRGGMGEVYRAEDTRLGRHVALKFLAEPLSRDQTAVERFRREARAASALNHPNVCAVYDVGEHDGRHFLAMELLEGATLQERIARGPLPPDQLIEIGSAVADALAVAHAQGLVHRDIKPANVFLTDSGVVKLLDFGLARPAEASSPDGETAMHSLTSPGSVVGTIAYMSPEQVRGETLDGRTDLFSLGAVLYEMATGRPAFGGSTAGTIHDAILNRAPTPVTDLIPTLPPRVDDVIGRALEKDRALRYQHAADLRADLQRLRRDSGSRAEAAAPRPVVRSPWRRRVPLLAGVAAVVALAAAGYLWRAQQGDAPIDSVAVLPFTNATGTGDTEYLSDGITESLIRDLSQLRNLRVVARSVVFRYKGKDVDPQAVGRELGVRAVLSGRLLQRDDRVIVRTELMSVADGTQLWGGELGSQLTNVFELQDQLSHEILERLRLRLTTEQRELLARGHTDNNEAYRLYLLGLHQWHKRSREGTLRAIEYLTQATRADPGYAPAYAALGDAYNFASFYVSPPREAMPKAKAAASRALELNPGLAEAHISLGYASFTYDWDWAAATEHFERARALNAAALETHTSYPFYLTVGRRHDEAIRVARATLEADPVSASASHNLAVQLSLAGRLEEGIAECRRTLELDPSFALAYQVMAADLAALGRYGEALPAVERSVELAPHPLSVALMGYVHARLGHRDAAGAVIARLESAARQGYTPALAFAVVYAGLGDRGRMFTWLERAYDERYNRLAYLQVEPVWREFHGDPRFIDLWRRIGLPN